jgi:hypothetical protein
MRESNYSKISWVIKIKKRHEPNIRHMTNENGGTDETRTRDLLRDRQAF